MNKNIICNIISLYGLSIVKMVFPLLTLPYLTRVLTVETYGIVSYVKTVMMYFQIFIDFGFLLSGTKDIVNSKNNIKKMQEEIANILFARIILVIISLVFLILIIFNFPILKEHRGYTFCAFIPIFLTVFLFDFVFRGIQKMQIITSRFFLMKSISTLFTFILIKDDTDLMWIPILDIASSLVAISFVFIQLKKMNICIGKINIRNSLNKLKQSAIYFFSNIATTVFSVLNTILIGIFLSKTDVAYWSLCIQIISTMQTLYTPIIDGVYPVMVQSKSASLIKKILSTFMPIVILGCIFMFFMAKYVLLIIGGYKYISSAMILKLLIPVLFFGFPAMLLGWPTLGALDQQSKVTYSTIISAVFQILVLFF